MISYAIAFRYAQALYKLPSSKEKLGSELTSIVQMLKNTPQLLSFFQAPQIGEKDKEKMLTLVMTNCSEESLKTFLLFLVRKGRIQFLPEILATFNRILNEHSDTSRVKAITAFPMDAQTKQILVKKLEKTHQKKIIIDEEVKPEILGGLILILGTRMMDGSIQHRLTKLKETLLCH